MVAGKDSKAAASRVTGIGRRRLVRLATGAALVTCLLGQGIAATAQDRQAAQPAQQPWRYFPKPTQAPAGAPNVLVVMTDDVGFAAASSFGGPIPTPAFDSVAENGLRYTRFHVTAMCSPSRAALLTGRNAHAVGYGAIANVAIDEPGYTSIIPESAATIGDVLRANGYDTAFIGKNHNTPDWESGPMGPFDRWPNGWGFDYFYGFNGPATDNFNPELVENRNPVRRDPADEGYFLERDLADRMVHWLNTQNSLNPDKPWLLYFAPQAMHGPQQAPADWIARFKGQFDRGWDVIRAETYARQKRMGIIPANAQLAPRPAGLPAWDSLSPTEKRVSAHLMEIAAAQLAFMDAQFGRVLDTLRETGQLDNTLILYVQGDNGAALHELGGTMNVYESFAQVEDTPEGMAARLHEAGTEETFGNYPAGWAFAMNTPFPWGKAIASHLGGTRNGLVVSWPARIKDKGTVRTQYGHLTDIAPTIYEAIGIAPPKVFEGVEQQPLDGASLLPSFADPRAPSGHREQYYEMQGTRSFYRDGWLAGTSVTWQPWNLNNYDPLTLPWELYNLDEDYSQTRNLADRYPEKLAEMKAGFEEAARRNNVFPLASDYLARLNPNRRPAAIARQTSYTFYPGDARYPIAAWPNVTPNWRATTRLTAQTASDSGPLFVMGAKFTGYALALEKGVPVFTYNPSGRAEERMQVRGTAALSPGDHQIDVVFTPQGSGVKLALLVDGQEVATAADDRFYRVFAGNALIGRPMLDDRTGPRGCDCTINSVTIEMK